MLSPVTNFEVKRMSCWNPFEVIQVEVKLSRIGLETSSDAGWLVCLVAGAG